MDATQETWISRRKAAKILGVDPKTALKVVNQGVVQSRHLPGVAHPRYTLSSVLALAATRAQASAPPADDPDAS